MKILYLAGRWDPTEQNEYSGSDYGAYHMLKKQPGVELFLVGPIEDKPNLIELVIFRIYHKLFKKQIIKYYPSSLRQSAKAVNRAITEFQPDVIFSKYSAPVVKAKINQPFVYMCDSTVNWTKKIWPHFSKLGFTVMENWESKAIQKSTRVITFSQPSAENIIAYYHKDPSSVCIFPIPAYIPKQLLPANNTVTKSINRPLKLLLVGKRYHLRGIDIAIQVCQQLNANQCPTELTIIGMDGENQEFVTFKGAYNKEDPQELQAYYDAFKQADLLIHPSRFHSAGIVISEAAAFGLPTITNAVGGLATTVQHDKTGLVLPKNSPSSAYVEAILKLIDDEDRYQRYRLLAKHRFDEQLNWEKAGDRLMKIIREVSQP